MKGYWDKTLEKIVLKFSANVGMIFRLNTDDNHLNLIAYTEGFPDELLEATQRISLDKGTIAAITAKNKKPVIIGNLSVDPSKIIVPMERMIGIGGMISVPVFHGDEVVGTIGIGCFHERKFTEQEAAELMNIGRKFADGLLAYEDENF